MTTDVLVEIDNLVILFSIIGVPKFNYPPTPSQRSFFACHSDHFLDPICVWKL